MAEINLLILSPHWRVALIRAFQKTREASDMNIKLVGADSDPNSAAQQVFDYAYTIPRFSSTGCLKEILFICEKENIHAVLPIINLAVEFLNTHRKAFEKAGVKLLLNGKKAIRICHDKLKLGQFCKQNRITTPEIFNPLDGELPFPLFAKQRRGEGGKNSMVLGNLHDLEYCRRKFPNHIFQQFIQGREFSIDWYSDFGGNSRVLVPRERLFVRAGEVMISQICLHPLVIETVSRIGKALQLLGPCTLQGFLAEEKFYLTDINLRFGSGFIHTIVAGADVSLLLFNELLGEESPTLNPVEDGLIMTRFNDGFYYNID